ncbi:MAG: purine-nucleoside phosphorylase [Gammaproteobacteria bacterium]|nr:purine-nucleoside phosphorylase [Gammaproteobacteria bacterium]
MQPEIQHAVDFIKTEFADPEPQTAIILGSGLGLAGHILADRQSLAYSDIPGFPRPSVRGHSGELIAGFAGSASVLIMQGRSHCYESGNPAAMKLPLRTLAGLGCRKIILTCAAGSLSTRLPPGSIMQVTDHINLTGLSPLTGETGDSRFVDLSEAYSGRLRDKLSAAAAVEGIGLGEGVYMWFPGPNFETPAEIRAAGKLGADAVGMSVVPETVLARHAGIEVAALAVITNYAAGISEQKLSHEQTIRVASKSEDSLARLLKAALSTLSDD